MSLPPRPFIKLLYASSHCVEIRLSLKNFKNCCCLQPRTAYQGRFLGKRPGLCVISCSKFSASQCRRAQRRNCAQVTREADFAFVSMQEDDAANYEACQLAQRLYRARRCIVPLIDPEWQGKFEEMGVLVIDPSTIAIGSIDQLLSSAQVRDRPPHQEPYLS
eukprot:6209154-Pleurochrysis_carterae.AAC.7